MTMRKVLLNAIAACALAAVAQAAEDMLPTDEVREAAPIGLVGEPCGSEQRAQHEQLATFAERFGEWIVTPAGTIPATLLDKPVAVADPDNPAVIVDPEKATQGKEAARQNEEAGRPFWQLDPENRPATFAERAEAEANQK